MENEETNDDLSSDDLGKLLERCAELEKELREVRKRWDDTNLTNCE